MDTRKSEIIGLRPSSSSASRLLEPDVSPYSKSKAPPYAVPSQPSFGRSVADDSGFEIKVDTKDDLIRYELRRIQAGLAPADRSWPHDIQTLVHFIHANIFEDWINVSAVKAECGFKNNNVSSRFKYTVGMGMRRYIEHLRMEAAGELLGHNASFQIFLIALSLGYASAESFNRSFRRYFSTTPSSYRVSARHLH
jgi:AraC family mar-sox-rob regulon transcriptional activator